MSKLFLRDAHEVSDSKDEESLCLDHSRKEVWALNANSMLIKNITIS